MARPKKRGLDYFPVDVDISEDPAIAYLEAVHGLVGYAVYLKLLATIYRGAGYYTSWSERDQAVFARAVHLGVDEVQEVVETAIEAGLFDGQLFETESVLTSRGIQERFVEITKKRKTSGIDPCYDLLSPRLDDVQGQRGVYSAETPRTDSFGVGNPTKTGVSAELSTQSKVKESKEKDCVPITSQVDTAPATSGSGTQIELSISEQERQDLLERFGEDNAAALLEAVRLDAENGKAVRSWYAVAIKYGEWRVRQGQMTLPRRPRTKCLNPECCNGWIMDDEGAKRCPECSAQAIAAM